MKYLFTFFLFITFAFSQQLNSYKVEFQKDRLDLYLKFSSPIKKNTIIQNKKNIEIKGIQKIKTTKKRYSPNMEEELLLYSKNNNLVIDLKTKLPYKIAYQVQNNLIHIKYIFLSQTDGLDMQYFLILSVLCLLIMLLFFVKKSLISKQKSKAFIAKHYFIDSKTKVLSIELNNTRYIVLITPKGVILLDRIIIFNNET